MKKVSKKIKESNPFSDQYLHPEWQKKRLKILERDNYMCRSCQNSETTLHIHHCVPYKKDAKVWEYEDNELITLCEDCHKEISNYIAISYKILMRKSWCVDSATEMNKIMIEINRMNIYQLNIAWKLLQLFNEY